MNQKPFFSRRQLLRGAAGTAALAATTRIEFPMAHAQNATNANATTAILATLKTTHPRLLTTTRTWPELRAQRTTDAALDAFLKRNEIEARAILGAPPMIYKKDGKRLLAVSRVVLRRVLLLASQFHLSQDLQFARRAESEMLAVSAFDDWNPSHFLDTAEMTAALAFGYDWLYDVLEPPARETIARAIIEKGLQAGLKSDGWKRNRNNWNSVCLCGISLGALAVAEREPQLAAQMLQIAKDFNHFGLEPYAPDGVYPEGAMYWGYGTTFQTVLLDGLQSALGTDWGLSQSEGFLESAEALYQQLGATGNYYNFSDGVERIGLEPAMWWFARQLKRPQLLGTELSQLQSYAASTRAPDPNTQNARLLPLAAVWWNKANTANEKFTNLPLNWFGAGATPLATFRGAWNDSQAMFLALKGGKATNSHGHMDAGSFIFEANGVRWGRDLGMQDYLSLESKGVDMWNSKQDGQRWTVFRLNPFSHSTLTINNQLHRADGNASITHFSDVDNAGAIVEMSPVFAGQATKVVRGFSFRPNSHVLIRDELQGVPQGQIVRWAMPTKAEITISADGTQAILSENKQQLRAVLRSSVGAKWEMLSIEAQVNSYDAPNPGMKLLIANQIAPASGNLDCSVTLQPLSPNNGDKAPAEKLDLVALNEWPQKPVKS